MIIAGEMQEGIVASEAGKEWLARLGKVLLNAGIGIVFGQRILKKLEQMEHGVLVREHLAIRSAEAKANELQEQGQLVAFCDNLLAGGSIGASVPRVRIEPTLGSPLSNELLEAAANDRLLEEVNVARAIHAAVEVLENNEAKQPETAPEPDWLRKWQRGAAEVSDSDLQGIWGRLLAGELTTPGTHSYRTLELLRGLSKKEAEEIARLKPYVLDVGNIYKDDYLDRAGITYAFLLQMQELGIVNPNLSSFTKPVAGTFGGQFIAVYSQPGAAIITYATVPDLSVRLDGYVLTGPGRNILALQPSKTDRGYLMSLCERISKSNKKLTVELQAAHPPGIEPAWPKQRWPAT